jgi:putative membrane protein insertion efficiency factor
MIRKIVLLPVRLYQLAISPWMPPACRYHPTCSHYMVGAVETHGVWKGILLGTLRLLRCAPWGGHGYDPVPPAPQRESAGT